MQITIDDQIFILQAYGGISRYFTELITAFRNSVDLQIEAVTPFRYVVNEHLIERDPIRYSRAPLPSVMQHRRILRTMNSPRARASADHSDVVHHTYYFPEYLKRPADTRVCTIYDMIPEHFPHLFPHGNPHEAKDKYVEVCDAILCISNTTKTDVLRHYGTLDKPIIVTPLGVGEQFFTASGDGVVDQRPYILFVGQRRGYKNFDVLLRAFSKIEARQHSLRLLCVGGAPFNHAELARIANLDLQGCVVHQVVTDAELPAVYASAICFVFPSLYEGFGLPTVEAFAAGCPVVLAKMECSFEVGASAAQFFSENDDEALAEIIERMVYDPASRVPWIAEGRKRALDYRWHITAQLTRDAYSSISRDH